MVLAGGLGLSLAANLAQAQPTVWGLGRASVLSGVFLVAVSIIDRPDGRVPYWPRRIARGGRVLAPGDPADLVQFIDVRDLAGWLADSCHAGDEACTTWRAPRFRSG